MPEQWRYTGKEAEPDSKHRINLGAAVQTPPGVRYRVMQNDIGQILLDPVVTIPAYEAWIYKNPEWIESIQRGIAEAEGGKLISRDLGNEEDD